jgi:hypothetical protein
MPKIIFLPLEWSGAVETNGRTSVEIEIPSQQPLNSSLVTGCFQKHGDCARKTLMNVAIAL